MGACVETRQRSCWKKLSAHREVLHCRHYDRSRYYCFCYCFRCSCHQLYSGYFLHKLSNTCSSTNARKFLHTCIAGRIENHFAPEMVPCAYIVNLKIFPEILAHERLSPCKPETSSPPNLALNPQSTAGLSEAMV